MRPWCRRWTRVTPVAVTTGRAGTSTGRRCEMTDRTDIVVVGAGVAGLVAAASAAVEGRRVTVLDAHPVGGRARSTVQQGFTLNLGAHALYRKGAFARELARLGVTPSGRSPAVDKGFVVKAGELHRLPVGATSLMTTSALKG